MRAEGRTPHGLLISDDEEKFLVTGTGLVITIRVFNNVIIAEEALRDKQFINQSDELPDD